jgi:hypothetical protein
MRDSGTERLEPEQLAVSRSQTHAATLMGINSSFRHAADGGSGRIIEIVEARCKLPMVGLKTLNDLETALRQNKRLGEILERFEEVALPDSWLHSTDNLEFRLRAAR